MDDIDASLLPTEQDVRDYEERGYYISRPVISDALLERARAAIMTHQSGKRDAALPDGVQCSDWVEGDGEGVRNNEFCSLQTKAIRELAWNPIIGAIAARLARTNEIRLFDDQAIYKPPVGESRSSAVGWHTDHSYWSTCTSTAMLTAWIPFDDATAESGTLTVVEGSHRWPESEHVRGFNNTDMSGLESMLGRDIPPSSIIPLTLAKGQMSFHHMRTLHASTSNVSGKPRLAHAVHLQDEPNRYAEFKTSDGTVIVIPHDQLSRRTTTGTPDYTDPAVFPTLWPTAASA